MRVDRCEANTATASCSITNCRGQYVSDYQRFIVDINPIPWRVPPFSVGRGKNRGAYVVAGRDAELHAYEEAVRDEITRAGAYMMPPPYMLQFWFCRNLGDNQNAADVTNMQKSTEDALQGTVIDNDTNVIDVFSHRLLQAETAPGFVIIEVWGEYAPPPPFGWVLEALEERLELGSAAVNPSDNEWPPRS